MWSVKFPSDNAQLELSRTTAFLDGDETAAHKASKAFAGAVSDSGTVAPVEVWL